MNKVKNRLLFGIVVLLFAFSCNNTKDTVTQNTPVVLDLLFPQGLNWLNTGVKVEIGKKIRISSGSDALGIPEVFTTDPLPTMRHGALIGRVGIDGYPFAIGTYSEIQGNSHNHGEYLYLGRNDTTDASPFGVIYQPVDLSIHIEILDTDAPGLISPRDSSWSSNALPTFDWDDVDDAIQYTIELSTFPDFRELEQSITTPLSYAQTTVPTTPIFPQQVPPTQPPPTLNPLPEGLHYWRVRAEFNAGRSLSPDFNWTEWSVPYVYGVELGTPPQAPEVISPALPLDLLPGTDLTVEFIEAPDPSGVFWRYWLKSGDCTDTPQIDPSADKPAVHWRAFSGKYELYDPNLPPYHYDSLRTAELTKANWLLRIEVRGGDDPDGTNSVSRDITINVGCER